MNPIENNQIVLLVEDSDDDAFFFERAFTDAAGPLQLIRVAHGGEAIEYLRRVSQASADLSQSHRVFLDLKMPVLNGFEVLKWIKERGIVLDIVMLSGSDIGSDMELARSLGACDYLVKPISAYELKKRLTREEVMP